MNVRGRVNLLFLALIGVIGLVAVIFFVRQDSMGGAGTRFLTALAKHDVNTLTELTYLDKRDPEQVRKQWDFAVNEAAKHYRFLWVVDNSTQADADNGALQLRVWRNLDSPSTYDERFQLPMAKEDGKWKVVVSGISREMFPGLPR
jgi:hypothetical protein